MEQTKFITLVKSCHFVNNFKCFFVKKYNVSIRTVNKYLQKLVINYYKKQSNVVILKNKYGRLIFRRIIVNNLIKAKIKFKAVIYRIKSNLKLRRNSIKAFVLINFKLLIKRKKFLKKFNKTCLYESKLLMF